MVEHFTCQPKVEGSRLATTAGTRGLYYKLLGISEIEKMDKFSSKLVFSALSATLPSLDKNTSLLRIPNIL